MGEADSSESTRLCSKSAPQSYRLGLGRRKPCWIVVEVGVQAGNLGGEGQFQTAGGVSPIAGQALPAAVVIQVTAAAGANTIHLSMGELSTFHVHFNLLCSTKKAQVTHVNMLVVWLVFINKGFPHV